MASNLLKAGVDVTVFDPAPEAVKKLSAAGAKAAPSPRVASHGRDFVVTMVRDDETSRKVWLDPTEGALAGMKPGSVALECSTITPSWARELAQSFEHTQVRLLEAPVSGSTPQAEDATLVFLVGGDLEVMKRAEPFLIAMGSSVKHAGASGSGALAKLVTNTFMGVQLATLAEMIGMLKRQGVDPKQVLSAVEGTPLWSPHLTSDAASMLQNAFEPHFPIRLLLKDLTYTVETAGGDSNVPTVAEVKSLFQKAVHQQLGDMNITAVMKLFEV